MIPFCYYSQGREFVRTPKLSLVCTLSKGSLRGSSCEVSHAAKFCQSRHVASDQVASSLLSAPIHAPYRLLTPRFGRNRYHPFPSSDTRLAIPKECGVQGSVLAQTQKRGREATRVGVSAILHVNASTMRQEQSLVSLAGKRAVCSCFHAIQGLADA